MLNDAATDSVAGRFRPDDAAPPDSGGNIFPVGGKQKKSPGKRSLPRTLEAFASPDLYGGYLSTVTSKRESSPLALMSGAYMASVWMGGDWKPPGVTARRRA